VLDEATSNLDAATERVVHEVIQNEFKYNTVITVARRLDTLRHCDLILTLAEGKVINIARPDEAVSTTSDTLLESNQQLY
jgi:ABC-type multidrug transport system fused ATPase/permease subunit